MARGDADPLLMRAHALKNEKQSDAGFYCYFLLGAGLLAPWNALITAADYFQTVYPGWHMDRLFTICYLPICLIMIGLTLRHQEAVTRKTRIVWAYVAFTALMFLVPLIDVVFVQDLQQAPVAALVAVLAACVAIGVFDGLGQGALFGEAAMLPPKYTHAVVGGTACSGMIICLIRLATKAALPATPEGLRISTAFYFTLAGLMSASCVLVYTLVMPRLPLLQFYREKAEEGQGLLGLGATDTEDDAELWGRVAAAVQPSAEMKRSAEAEEEGEAGHAIVHLSTHSTEGADISSSYQLAAGQGHSASVLKVWSQNWELSVTLVVVYAVTLSIFPGFLAEDVHSDTLGTWYPELLITAFNFADLVGKNLPHSLLPLRPPSLLACAGSRVVFFPVFILAAMFNVHPAVMIALTLLLGLTSGYLTAVAMTVGAEGGASQQGEVLEHILVFSLVAGLNIGAFAGWLWLL